MWPMAGSRLDARSKLVLVPLCGTFSVVNRFRRLRPGQLHLHRRLCHRDLLHPLPGPSGLSGGPVGGAMSFLPQLMAILLAIEPPPAARFTEFTANFEARLKGVLQRAEAATVKRALHTWQELQGVLASAGVAQPDKHLLATFVRQHAAPARAFTALGWLVRD